MKKEKVPEPRTELAPSDIGASKWQLQHAKARLSELIRLAVSQGPQIITLQGKDLVVVLPIDDYTRLTAIAQQPKRLSEFFAQSPLVGINLNVSRDKSVGRSIDLE